MGLRFMEHILILTDDPDGTRDWWCKVLGFRSGDKITHINGKLAKGISLNQAVQNITGPVGTIVTLFTPGHSSLTMGGPCHSAGLRLVQFTKRSADERRVKRMMIPRTCVLFRWNRNRKDRMTSAVDRSPRTNVQTIRIAPSHFRN